MIADERNCEALSVENNCLEPGALGVKCGHKQIFPSMASPTSAATPRTLTGKIISHIIGLLFCVGLPAFVTAIAPVAWLKLNRQGEQVSAHADTCLLFFIPYKTRTIDSVTELDQRSQSGSYTRHRRSGPDRYTQSEDQGFLILRGPAQEIEVEVTPHDIDGVEEKVEAFMKDRSATELKLFLVANWKFSVIAGGLVSLLTLLYVGGAVFALVKFLLGLLRG